MIDLDSLNAEWSSNQHMRCTTYISADTVCALIAIARAAAVWTHARRVQSGTPVGRSILADAVAIAVEQAGL